MMIIMASAHKKDFWATKVEDSLLGDEQWHSVTVCQVNINSEHPLLFQNQTRDL